MPIVRRTRADADAAAVTAEMAAHPELSDAAVEAMAAEDDSVWTDEDFAKAEVVIPPPSPAEVMAQRRVRHPAVRVWPPQSQGRGHRPAQGDSG